jgi:adenylate cyclase
MNANNEAIASQAGMGSVFRLRGVDIHRVVRCTAIEDSGVVRAAVADRGTLGQLDELTRRLALCGDYGEATRAALESLDDLFGYRQSILLVRAVDEQRLFAVASNGYPGSSAGAEVPLGVGVIGIAAERRQVVSVPNLARSRIMNAAIRAADDATETTDTREIPLPGLVDAQSVAAVPLLAQGDLTGALYLESSEPGTFGAHNERLLRIVGGHVASVLRALDADVSEQPRVATPEPTAASAAPATGDPLRVTYYQADDSVFVDDAYVVKGVPGRILWKLVNEHAAEGRETFTNRELRLDERLGLPPGNDNLEARLLVLRKRLAGGEYGIALERVGRGRLQLRVARPLALAEIATSGPMRAAHERQQGE